MLFCKGSFTIKESLAIAKLMDSTSLLPNGDLCWPCILSPFARWGHWTLNLFIRLSISGAANGTATSKSRQKHHYPPAGNYWWPKVAELQIASSPNNQLFTGMDSECTNRNKRSSETHVRSLLKLALTRNDNKCAKRCKSRKRVMIFLIKYHWLQRHWDEMSASDCDLFK